MIFMLVWLMSRVIYGIYIPTDAIVPAAHALY